MAYLPPRAAPLSALLASLVLSGCTQYWAKPGGTPAEFEATKASCEQQSYGQFPPMPMPVMISPGYTTPIQTTCNGFGYSVSCTQTGGQSYPPSCITVDQNQGARQGAVRSCLFEAGWQPVKNKEEAAAIASSGRSVTPQMSAATPSGDAWSRAHEAAKGDCQRIFEQPGQGVKDIYDNSVDKCIADRTLELVPRM
jgi:hypothetical protein